MTSSSMSSSSKTSKNVIETEAVLLQSSSSSHISLAEMKKILIPGTWEHTSYISDKANVALGRKKINAWMQSLTPCKPNAKIKTQS